MEAATWITAVATAVLAIFTIALATFAGLAYKWTKREVDDNRTHFEKQLNSTERQLAEAEAAHRATLRPEVVVSNLDHRRDDRGYLYTASVRNVGTGPALQVEGEVWCAYEHGGAHTLRLNGPTARSLAQQLGQDADGGSAPDANVLPFALGAGETREFRFRVSDRLIACALFRIRCEDVFGTKFNRFGPDRGGDFVTCQ
jgi:hypothetical protein